MIIQAFYQSEQLLELPVSAQTLSPDTGELVLSSTLLCSLLHYLTHSESYRASFLLRHPGPVLWIRLRDPPQAPLDYLSCQLARDKVWRQAELEDALHWLSTLGGAYSNLGEHSVDFAIKAGHNALKQMSLILQHSYDPSVLSKCCLFLAMSWMQQKQLKRAKAMIVHVFRNVQEDALLKNMCQGIWSRLKHQWKCK